MAIRCSTELVEAPIAITAFTASKRAVRVRISWVVMPSFTMATIRLPLARASLRFSEETAGEVPIRGRVSPSTSARQLMVLAVPIMEQEPTVGSEAISIFRSSS